MAYVKGSTAYIVGGGIGGLTAATYLIKAAGWPGANIQLIDGAAVVGGALDGIGDRQKGFVARGERMMEIAAYPCLWKLLGDVPTLDGKQSVLDETKAFNTEVQTNSHCRLVDNNHKIIDSTMLELSEEDQHAWLRLLCVSEESTQDKRIQDWFSPAFFTSNFWAMWRTLFGYQNWHGLTEMRRYMLMFGHVAPFLNTLAPLKRTKLIGYDSIARPIEKWLVEQGVIIKKGTRILDVDFAAREGGSVITALHGDTVDGAAVHIPLKDNDIAIITIGSLVADSSFGYDDSAPELITDRRDGAWTIWDNMAAKFPELGNPQKFYGTVRESKWQSYTLTMRSPVLFDRIVKFTNNKDGTGALVTFKDSSWFLSSVVPHQPYFANQPGDVFTSWGYSLLGDNPGDYVKKPMAHCSGKEILTELIGHFGFNDILDEALKTTTVITTMMPYITAEFMPRKVSDRPPVIPHGALNFALIGQFVEIPKGCVFTVDYSVRGALHAVNGLCKTNIDIPAPFQTFESKDAIMTIKAILSNKELPIPAT